MMIEIATPHPKRQTNSLDGDPKYYEESYQKLQRGQVKPMQWPFVCLSNKEDHFVFTVEQSQLNEAVCMQIVTANKFGMIQYV